MAAAFEFSLGYLLTVCPILASLGFIFMVSTISIIISAFAELPQVLEENLLNWDSRLGLF